MVNTPSLVDLRLFVDVVRLGSFARTATESGMSPSYVSKRIGILETDLGVRLLHRTSRRVSTTPQGEKVYELARGILAGVEQMQDALVNEVVEPQGRLRVSSSFRLGRNHVAPAISLLARRFPKLEISLTVLDRPVDLLSEGFDLDIRIGGVPEPHLIAHRITQCNRILCAAPSYLERHGTPTQLAELSQHACLVFRERDQPFGTWRLVGPRGLESVKVTGALSSNNNDIIRQWALDGHGIIRLAEWDCAKSLHEGELVQVLPAYRWPVDIWAVTTGRLAESAKISVCVNFLRDQLTHGPHALWPPGFAPNG
ncbi:LysR family transcriptional regulator [Cupriavidus gilardii J11]|uniref:LysR family transcriptional regulator n=1 Tax=Cupriavidus gilardii J11 TaxID=936133 RepID=A0A562BTY8_9BURK|nr:LysR family transcriptional regulator [Cupriavidus gilardii]TWG88662.1 LysR family transcriptional regulator [Cupriavidus gilardii J11]